MHIAVYAVAKNESQFAERWAQSVQDADSITVLDTGSTDNTAEILQANGVKVFQQAINPWHASQARNIALDHLPLDVDICFSLDIDEVPQSDWRTQIEKAWQPTTDYAFYHYVWSFNTNGTPACQYWQFRLHRRHGVRWFGRRHEKLEYTGDASHIYIPDLLVSHYPDPHKKPRPNELEALQADHAEFNTEFTAFYLGREYYYAGMMDNAIPLLRRVVLDGRLDDFAQYAARVLCELTGELRWAKRALEFAATRQNWFYYAESLAVAGRLREAKEAAEKALAVQSGLAFAEITIEAGYIRELIDRLEKDLNEACVNRPQRRHNRSQCHRRQS